MMPITIAMLAAALWFLIGAGVAALIGGGDAALPLSVIAAAFCGMALMAYEEGL